MKKFSKKFAQLLDFVKFTEEFREVVRYEGSKLGKKVETSNEHSYQVAMVAWFLIEQDNLKLNKELCLMYALAHDLVEIYAEDTFIFDKKKKVSKHQREKEALVKIKKRFSKFKNLIKIIQNYEKREDEESKFIYILDKLLPPIQIYLEDGKMWHKKKVSLLKQLNYKNKILSSSSYFDEYWQELKKELIKNKKKLFPK
ncbi:HD domain-containing protein [Candidatus Nomurabacteria bacterium]|nr:HD domain-containing protein [Candidatus Nomurabacteria bacterium]